MANSNSYRILCFAFITIFLTGCSSTQAEQGTEVEGYFGDIRTTGEVDAYLESKMAEYGIPGLSFVMITDGEVVHHRTMGSADLEENLPVTDETLFEGASLSKSMFAFFVMTYVEEGRLDLDRPLYEYMPYPDIAYDERYKKITARMVLSHRAGFPNWRRDEPDGRLRIKFEPGTDFLYSGEGYQYLAMVLRSIENTDWEGLESIFQQKIAEPIGLEHTVFLQTPYTREHKATAYDDMRMRINKMDDRIFGAAYSIHTESLDFSKWMIAVMNGDLLSEESYEELFAWYSSVPSDMSSSEFDVYYTLGFVTVDAPDTNIYMHSGNNDGFTSLYLLDPEKDWGYAVFTNSEFGVDLGNDLVDFLIGEPEE